MTEAVKKSGVWALLWAIWALAMVVMATPLFAAPAPFNPPINPALAAAVAAASPVAAPAATDSTSPLFPVSFSMAEDAVSRALITKGVGAKVAATMNGQRGQAVYRSTQPLTVEVHGLQFDKLTHRWSASLLMRAANGDVITAIPASGRFEEMIEVPVLKREVHGGDVIHEQDVEVQDFPLTHTRSDTITDIADLIGKSPVRGISPERPIRESEVQNPAIVKKNDIVQMRFSTPGLTITALGQALEEGAKGDVIEVRNTASKKIVRASIEDQNTVNILSPDEQQASPTAGAHYAAN